MQTLSLILLIIAAVIIAPAFRNILSLAETIGLTLLLAIFGTVLGNALITHFALPTPGSGGIISLALALGFLGTSSLEMLVLRFSRSGIAGVIYAESSMLHLQIAGLTMSLLGVLCISLNYL